MTDEAIRLRKRIRLPDAAYRQPGSSWLVTITTAERRSHFADSSLAGATLALLTEEAPRRGLELHLACLMPDHVHLLASVTTGDLVQAIAALKSQSTKVFYGFGGSGHLWQRSFHDQGLRSERAYEETVRYILHNPVVAGLTERWEEYDLIDGTLLATLMSSGLWQTVLADPQPGSP